MLSRLAIHHIALIKDVELDLHSGLTVLTGETGAGKSMVMDALALCLGERADTGLIRAGGDEARVEATFSLTAENPPLQRALAAQAIELEEGELILRRTLNRTGKSRAFANGCQITQSQMQELGERLGDIHGQHDHQLLLRAHRHAEILDRFGDLKEERRTVRATHTAWQEAHHKLRDLHARVEDQAREEALLKSYVQELETLGFTPEEEAELLQERARLRLGERLGEAVEMIAERLSHSAGISQAVSILNQAGEEGDADLAELAARVEEWTVETDDLSREMNSLTDKIAPNPIRLDELERRLHTLQDVARKHRVELNELPRILRDFQQQLEDLTLLQEGEDELEQKEQIAWQSFADACGVLSQGRQKFAHQLEAAVEKQLADLMMPDMRFQVAMTDLAQSEWGSSGAERVAFMVAPNVGSEFHPLDKVASGGEVSRLMLALKAVFYAAMPPMTLVFDEIDTGTGGAVADAVGDALHVLGQRHQVLAITHLPQVAAKGEAHLKIEKLTDGETTRTMVTALDEHKRQEELARMLSGRDVTEQARAAAASLLKGAA